MKILLISLAVLFVTPFYLAFSLSTSQNKMTYDNYLNIAKGKDRGKPTLSAHPLSISALRSGTYLGSEILKEEGLENGSNYKRSIVSYKSEGNKIFALLTVPLGKKPVAGWPVVVFNHGYTPPKEYKTTKRYIAYVDGFARNGYVVFRSDYRGHGRPEGVASLVDIVTTITQ